MAEFCKCVHGARGLEQTDHLSVVLPKCVQGCAYQEQLNGQEPTRRVAKYRGHSHAIV